MATGIGDEAARVTHPASPADARSRWGRRSRWATAVLALVMLAGPIGSTDRMLATQDDPDRSMVIAGAPTAAVPPPRLDVVVLLLDDIGVVGEDLWRRLPVIRRTFLDTGVVFSQAFGDTPMCCPGRSSFLTGLWTWHHGVTRNDGRLLHDGETIGTAMTRAGYRTMYVGKYLNALPVLSDLTPDGWWRTSLSEGRYYRYSSWRNGRMRWFGSAVSDHSTDVVARDALDFLRQVPRGDPLFAVLAPYASHSGDDRDGTFSRFGVPAQRHVGDARCAGLGRFRTPATDEADVSDKPAHIRRLPRLRWGLQHGWPLGPICETLLSTDELLGHVRSELARQGRLDRTVFLLVSDNGMNMGLHRLKAKGSPYATPIPLMISWPGGVRPAAGPDGISRHAGLVSMVDLAPTLCAIAGCHLGPYPSGQRRPDGRSLMTTFRDGSPTGRLWTLSSHPEDGWHEPGRPGWFALRTAPEHPLGAWLFVRYRTGESELYDLARDAHLLDNVADRATLRGTREQLESELLRRLHGRYRWR